MTQHIMLEIYKHKDWYTYNNQYIRIVIITPISLIIFLFSYGSLSPQVNADKSEYDNSSSLVNIATATKQSLHGEDWSRVNISCIMKIVDNHHVLLCHRSQNVLQIRSQ